MVAENTAKSGPDKDRSAAALFRRAALTPSGLSVAVTIAVAAALLLLFGVVVQLAAGSALGELFAKSPTDHNAFVVSQVSALADAPTERPLVVFIGASVMRSSLGTTEELKSAFERRSGHQVDVLNLCTSAQPILAQLALIDRLPRNRPVILLLDNGPRRFTTDRQMLRALYDGDYLAVWSPEASNAARQIGLDAGRHTGIALLDYPLFYLSRTTGILRNLARIALGRSPVRHDEEQYVGLKQPEKTYRAKAAEMMKLFERAEEPIAMNRELLARTVAFAKARPNITLVLVEHPINPSFVSEYLGHARYSEHLSYMRRFAAEHDVPYWTIGLDLQLGPESFYDWAHIASDDAQKALREELVDRVVTQKWTE